VFEEFHNNLSLRAIKIRALSHHITWRLGAYFPDAFPFVFVVGYPRSGTVWVCELIADFLKVPFPKNSLLPVGCPAVVHGHETVWPQYRHCVYVLRDGRDSLVSNYFLIRRRTKTNSPKDLHRIWRRYLDHAKDLDDVEANLPKFIERSLERPWAPVHWGKHVEQYLENQRENTPLIRYEELLTDGPNTLANAMATLTEQATDLDQATRSIEKFSFKSVSGGRKPGQADQSSIRRKGICGDWVNYFTREAAEVFDSYCGESLIAAGYEKDRSWIDACSNK